MATGPPRRAGGGKQPRVTSAEEKQGKQMLRRPGPSLSPVHWGKGGFGDGVMDGEYGLATGPAPVSVTLPLPQPQTPASLFLEIFVKCRQFS